MLEDYVRRAQRAKAAHDEGTIRHLLERWVSEMEPAIVMHNSEIIGLCIADAMIGTKPFILEA